MTNDDKAMYLLLCGWAFIKTPLDNLYWKGRDAWYTNKLRYEFLDAAYKIQRQLDGFNDK
jgi:hypothetical protein